MAGATDAAAAVDDDACLLEPAAATAEPGPPFSPDALLLPRCKICGRSFSGDDSGDDSDGEEWYT